ncbi:MAG: RDD family protein [Bacillota bacterium]
MDLRVATLKRRLAASASTAVAGVVCAGGLAVGARLLEMGNAVGISLLWGALLGGGVLSAASWRATYGMRVMGIRLGRVNGGQIGFGRCLVRVVVGMVVMPLAPVSWIVAMRDERRRGLADWICGTVVWEEAKEEERVRRGFEMGALEEREHI